MGGNTRSNEHETSSQKVYKQYPSKLTPAAFKNRLKYGGTSSVNDANSIAMTAKPGNSFHLGTTNPYSKTLAHMQHNELATTQKRWDSGKQGPQESRNEQMRQPSSYMQLEPVGSREIGGAHNAYPVALQSRAEMDLQLRDLEYKIGAAERKN